jgi:hypothetical protein
MHIGEFVDPEVLLSSQDASISQLFALLRQWEPRTQDRASAIIHRILDLGECVSHIRFYIISGHYPVFVFGDNVEEAMIFLTPSLLLPSSCSNAGGTPNDRDAMTDMTPLHFAVKSGARGITTSHAAVGLVRELIDMVSPFVALPTLFSSSLI